MEKIWIILLDCHIMGITSTGQITWMGQFSSWIWWQGMWHCWEVRGHLCLGSRFMIHANSKVLESPDVFYKRTFSLRVSEYFEVTGWTKRKTNMAFGRRKLLSRVSVHRCRNWFSHKYWKGNHSIIPVWFSAFTLPLLPLFLVWSKDSVQASITEGNIPALAHR